MGRRVNPTCSTIRKGYQKLEWWSIAEAAEHSGLSVSTVYEHGRQGNFNISKGPSPYKVYRDSFTAYMQTGESSEIREPKNLFNQSKKRG